MPNFRVRDFSAGWSPDSDAENAPPGVALRADNLVLDETGAISVRKGSSLLDTGLVGGAAHTLRSMYLNDTLYRFAGVGNGLYANGVSTGLTFDGTGDMSIGTDAYQAFFARGTTKKKFDGTHYFDWGVKAPEFAPTLSAANAVTLTVATFATGESPAFTVTEGTRAFVTGADGTGSGATQLTTNAAGKASEYKTLASDTDMLNIAGTVGADTDIFDFYAAVSNIDHMNSVTVMFGLGTGTDPFLDDYYTFTWDFKGDPNTNLKNSPSLLPNALLTDAQQVIQSIAPEDITKYKTPQEVTTLKGQTGLYGNPISTPRQDSVQSSPAWFHLSTSRGQFTRTGQTSGRDWTTVRGMKVVANTVSGGNDTVTFDTALWYAGGSRALSGLYYALCVAVRDNGTYFELSRPSPISSPITLNQNGLNVTISAATLAGLDGQANQLWIYLFSGTLGGWYRFAITGSSQSGSQSMDEFDPSPDTSIDANDRTRFNQWGLTIPGFNPNAAMTVSIRKSEIDALREGVRLVPYLSGPPDNIVAIAGPYLSRMFALTSEGWLYVSAQGSPSHFSIIQTQDLRRYGDPKWMVLTTGGLFIGMTKDIIRLGGTGDEDENANADFFPQPLGVGNPPVDQAFFTDGSAIVYRAADGLMTAIGAQTTPVTQEGTILLWRGQSRHGVQALNIETGRFRLAVDNHILYMIAPEGTVTNGSNVIYRYDTIKQHWYRTTYGTTLFYSIHRDPDGRLIAGDSTGNVWLLEDTQQDNGSNIAIFLRLPISDNGQPMRRKTAFDLTVAADTGNTDVMVAALIDGSAVSSGTYTVNTNGDFEYRQNIFGLPDFTRLQFEITGSVYRFILRNLNIGYRAHPQQRMAIDTGYIRPPGNSDLGWIAEVEVSVRSASDLQLIPYFNDVAQDIIPVPVIPNVYKPYRVVLNRRQNKGYKPRLLLQTTAAAAVNNPGFEMEWMRVRFRGTGNVSEKVFQVVPDESAQ